ncbi:hypothetical protein [Treponema sp. R80B11-R83G3]
MKKHILQIIFLIFFLACFLVLCKNTPNNDEEQSTTAKTANVTFFNESRYNLKIHRDNFDGPVLLELPRNSSAKTISVRVSDNNGIGTMFSIEYIWVIQIIESLNGEIKEVEVSGTDPGLQIPSVIEADKPCTIQIPDPKNIEIRSAYMTIKNAYILPCELYYLGTTLRQTDNNIPIAPDKTGIYKNRYVLPAEGELYQNYRVGTVSESVPIPDFLMKNGVIYHFNYNGIKVEKIKEENIVFNRK